MEIGRYGCEHIFEKCVLYYRGSINILIEELIIFFYIRTYVNFSIFFKYLFVERRNISLLY